MKQPLASFNVTSVFYTNIDRIRTPRGGCTAHRNSPVAMELSNVGVPSKRRVRGDSSKVGQRVVGRVFADQSGRPTCTISAAAVCTPSIMHREPTIDPVSANTLPMPCLLCCIFQTRTTAVRRQLLNPIRHAARSLCSHMLISHLTNS